MKRFISLIFFAFPFFIYGKTFNVSSVQEFVDALNTASNNGENDTIVISSSNYNLNSTISFWSEENYSILIRGEGTVTFDGNGSTRIMQLITTSSMGNITVENITFINGNGEYGGGLYAETQDAEIKLRDCTFNNNTAGFVGGGANLYSITGNITVENCIFSSKE